MDIRVLFRVPDMSPVVRAVKRIQSLRNKDGTDVITEELVVEIMPERTTMKTESSFSLRSEESGHYPPNGLFSCRPRVRPQRSMSEASMYMANSRCSLKTGVAQENKALDRLMHCLWLCSPGCQETA